MAWCDYCDRSFVSSRALQQHIDNSAVHECSLCYYHFDDMIDYEYHRHGEHVSCEDCDEWFADAERFHHHNIYEHGERYCTDCRRRFIGASQYNSHRNSSMHMAKNVPCAYRNRGCTRTFIDMKAMVLHLESGACISGFTRADVNRNAIALDRNKVIVDSSRLIGNGTAQTSYYTDRAFNGHAWECYLCNSEFRTQAALNQHVYSPKHEGKIYVCPCSTCRQRFATLSGFMQHVDSDSCGVKRFRVVQDAMAQLTSGLRRIAL